MKFSALFILMLTFLNVHAQSNANDIQKCFKAYKAAIIEGRGSDAAELVDNNTLDYYARMLEMSIYADSATVQEVSMIDKMTIFTTRHRIPKDTLLTMNGRTFFIYAINSGMVGKNSVVSLDLGEIDISGQFAKGQIVSAGQASPLSFDFNRENEEWKMDITSIFPASEMTLNQMLKQNGLEENEYIFQMLQFLTNRPVDDKLWQPL